MTPKTENDLCTGYRGQTGVNGICSCGLYWEGQCPPHDADGRLMDLERVLRRMRRVWEAEAVRCREALLQLQRRKMQLQQAFMRGLWMASEKGRRG
jgi:hypothetical protein